MCGVQDMRLGCGQRGVVGQSINWGVINGRNRMDVLLEHETSRCDFGNIRLQTFHKEDAVWLRLGNLLRGAAGCG